MSPSFSRPRTAARPRTFYSSRVVWKRERERERRLGWQGFHSPLSLLPSLPTRNATTTAVDHHRSPECQSVRRFRVFFVFIVTLSAHSAECLLKSVRRVKDSHGQGNRWALVWLPRTFLGILRRERGEGKSRGDNAPHRVVWSGPFGIIAYWLTFTGRSVRPGGVDEGLGRRVTDLVFC